MYNPASSCKNESKGDRRLAVEEGKGRWFEFDSKEPISPGFISKIEKEKTSTESLKPKTLVSGNCN